MSMLRAMGNEIRCYGLLVRAALRAQMQYRADFFIGFFGTLLFNLVYMGSIGFLAARFEGLHGWSTWEVVFVYSLFMCSHSFYGIFLSHIPQISTHVIQGTMDAFFLRPISILAQVLGNQVNYAAVVNLVIGVAGAVVCYRTLGLQWRIAQWLLLPVLVLSGCLVEFAISWMLSCVSFWHPNVRKTNDMYMLFINVTQRYPLDMFHGFFQLFLTWLLPIAFINYYPALYLLNKQAAIPGGEWLCLFTPVMALLLIGCALWIWRKALASYTSAGG